MKQNDKLKTEYLNYLMMRSCLESEGMHGYSILCEILMQYNFFPILDMDENRSFDCLALRRDFAEGYDDDAGDILDEILGQYGTMMELILVLSEKMSYDLADSKYESDTGKWFKELLQNCGLVECCNDWFMQFGQGASQVVDILDTINYRKFGWDGEGGFFPLLKPKSDQRFDELIIQMNNYIEENYDIC